MPQYAGGRPFCFCSGSAAQPEEEWLWEECDIPVCEVTIAVLSNTAPGLVLATCPHCTLCSCRADGQLLQLTQRLIRVSENIYHEIKLLSTAISPSCWMLVLPGCKFATV